MKGVYIFLADGFEETEAIATLDVLRRGGIDVSTVSISAERQVTGSHGIAVIADMNRKEFKSQIVASNTKSGDAMVFPGGMPGTKNLASDEELMFFMMQHYASGGTVAAICAAPGLVVSQLGSLKGKKFTCYDGFEDALIAKGAEYVKAPAVKDGNLITGRGPGCAIEFGLKILEHLKDSETAQKVRQGLLIS